MDKDSFGPHSLFLCYFLEARTSTLEKLTLMDAMGTVHEHAPGPPRVKNILFFCLVCAFNFGHLVICAAFLQAV